MTAMREMLTIERLPKCICPTGERRFDCPRCELLHFWAVMEQLYLFRRLLKALGIEGYKTC